MTTKQYLGQLKNIDKRIKDKIEEARKWREVAENPSPMITDIKVQTSVTPDRMGDAMALALDYEKQSADLAIALMKLKHKIIEQIDNIGNTKYYDLLKGYYLNGQTYEELISPLGYYSRRSIERKMQEALRAFEAKYGYTFLDQKPYLETVA